MNRQRNKEYTKKILIDSAMELFKKQSFQQTTIQNIVDAAGFSKPTFFAYFKSKEQILYEFDLNQMVLLEELQKKVISQGENLLEGLAENIVKLALMLHTTTMFTQNTVHLLTVSEAYKEMLAELFNTFKMVVKVTIDYGQQNGIVKPEICSKSISDDVINIYMGTLLSWLIFDGNEPLEKVMGTTLKNYLQGIALPKS